MKPVFVYHKLHVWHMAKDLVKLIYSLTSKFPAAEKYGLVSQINRAVISVASNIAEGSGRTSRKDQAHFTQLAYGSLMEVACQMEIAMDLDFIAENDLLPIMRSVANLSEKLSALRTAQLRSDTK
ncbi:MAG: four helix bundle protein [Desulfuromonadaceae bacterium]|nr:four helix bundle protein [Desulfuromonadaceae bacterium]